MSRLERWSRLKRNVPQEQDAPPASSSAEEPVNELAAEPNASPNEVAQPPHGPDATQTPPEPGSLDHTLPDPETLEAGSDFSAFMVPGVSGALRRRALKRLWSTGNYNVRDGLDDYDADYNKLLKPMGSELASKLRRWTHKVEEVVDKSLEDAEPESHKELTADEPTNEPAVTLEAESSMPCADSDNIVKNAPLDDQSDYLSGTKTKT
ncbi:DUF3306 domain-containing protein [Halomonas sp. ISL-60]|uniref:DUF3306 domain-containing protein n=1 Tax=unclassified Halomonas TaxID=2609666 RepID=UPI0007D9FA0F|nr:MULTISPECIES: DUF3306 domain-containing protein [unclassified Halomonas]MBT2773291.1 DUF3306 domain-containing protein [Halomonas sp. ISL-60]MBT2786144.1 DUF3306 domain-containing protein [Halomonas sp. ISL-106]MBT2797166.1 DUF3306 domain-containing protein [Halomonas sp. ISL-104]MBT2801861.1 DUF3306 domain-containing protein [Halomonas sp. ISL-56]OAL58547.1 hypothetical protein A6R74_06545 [Halomonas sp. ALS9]